MMMGRVMCMQDVEEVGGVCAGAKFVKNLGKTGPHVSEKRRVIGTEWRALKMHVLGVVDVWGQVAIPRSAQYA
jgi:hypothetical protein